MKQSLEHFLKHGHEFTLQGISIDNVIFGFHEGQLKVLLLQSIYKNMWMLPGGFVNKTEHIDEAASRILKERTGLSAIYLQQFYTFGQPERANNQILVKFLQGLNKNYDKDNWALQRFVSVGYYALVEFAKVNPQHPGEISTASSWHDLDKLPELLMDHNQIISKALEELRLKINNQPIGYNLLPKEFTMKSLQSIYETILGRKLDRANFNRKMLSYGILDRKEKQYSGGAHKAPYLYSFNKKKYFKALQSGLGRDF
ncbi:MAG TPA: NUDIX domain-containing protein [Cyclobacteriaceae bacterium]|nr:NUDIX domain-containing protein [Cyclobacteriaceae bacterium]